VVYVAKQKINEIFQKNFVFQKQKLLIN